MNHHHVPDWKRILRQDMETGDYTQTKFGPDKRRIYKTGAFGSGDNPPYERMYDEKTGRTFFVAPKGLPVSRI